MVLANGDRRDCFVVIDQAADTTRSTRSSPALTLEEMRGRLSDLDRAALPSVEQAKESRPGTAPRGRPASSHDRPAPANTRGQANTPSDGRARGPQPEIKPLGKTAGEIRLAWRLTATAAQFAQEIEKRGLILVHVTPEQAQESHRKPAFAKAVGRQNRALREGFAVVDQRGNVTRIDQRTTGDLRAEIDKRLGGIDRDALMNVNDARQVMADANKAAWQPTGTARAQRMMRLSARRPGKFARGRAASDGQQHLQGTGDRA